MEVIQFTPPYNATGQPARGRGRQERLTDERPLVVLQTDKCAATFSGIQPIERAGQSLNLGPQ
jgi:hypothetical protein